MKGEAYVDNVQGFLNGSLSVERHPGIDFRRNFARHNFQDFLSKLRKKTVEGGIDLLVDVLAVTLAIRDGFVDELCILWLFRRSENEGRVGGGILRLVLVDCCEITGIADNNLL